MFIIGLVLLALAVIVLVVYSTKEKYDRESCGNAGATLIIIGGLLVIIGGTVAMVTYYSVYPELEAFYDSNLGNYQTVVERQNEVAVMNLEGPTEGEFFDGSDFSQSRETSSRYREYRDATNEYNVRLTKYRRLGGTFIFWPMPQPDNRLKIVEIK